VPSDAPAAASPVPGLPDHGGSREHDERRSAAPGTGWGEEPLGPRRRGRGPSKAGLSTRRRLRCSCTSWPRLG